MVRVVIATPYPTTRAGLSAVVGSEPGCVVVAEVASVDELVARAEDHAPDVALIDPGDDAEDWLDALWRLADSRALPPVVLLLAAGQPGRVPRGLRPSGVLLRDATSQEIGLALRAATLGLVVLDGRVADDLGQTPPPAPDLDVEAAPPLTTRELEVLRAIARGLPNKAIAIQLGISEHTVKFHVGSILRKLNASSRAEALARAAHAGLIAL